MKTVRKVVIAAGLGTRAPGIESDAQGNAAHCG